MRYLCDFCGDPVDSEDVKIVPTEGEVERFVKERFFCLECYEWYLAAGLVKRRRIKDEGFTWAGKRVPVVEID